MSRASDSRNDPATPRIPFTADATALWQESTLNDFLPSVRPWVQVLGLVLAASLVGSGAALGVLPYRVVVRGTGLVRPVSETSVVNTSQAGIVRTVAVRLNQRVRRGQLLAVLDPAKLHGQQQALNQGAEGLERQRRALVLQGAATVAAAEQDIAKAQAAVRLAGIEVRRFEQLAASGAGSLQQMQEKQAANSVAEANLAQAYRSVAERRFRNMVERAQVERQLKAVWADQLQVNRDLLGTQVRSPVDGVVLSLALRNPLQVVSQGEELARIAPTGDNLVVQVQVADQEITSVRQGQQADLKVAGCPFPDYGTLSAQVQAVAPDASTGSSAGQSSTYGVMLHPAHTVLHAGPRRCTLRQGMEVEAAITTRQETLLTFLLRKTRLWIDH